MAIVQKMFGVQKGVMIDGTIALTTTIGIPSGNDYNILGIGSYAFDSSNGLSYQKITDTNSSADWVTIATTADITNAMASIVHVSPWLENALVYDSTYTTLPTTTPGDIITLTTGEDVVNDSRVIFSALTTDKGVYKYDQLNGVFIPVNIGSSSNGYRILVPLTWSSGTSTFVSGNPKTYLNLGNNTWVLDDDVVRTVLSSLTSTNYISTTDTTQEAFSKLDLTLAGIAAKTVLNSVDTVTTITNCASFLTSQYKRVTLIVEAILASDPTKFDTFYVDVTHDGINTGGAVNINESGRYNDQLGFSTESLTGITYSFTLTGTGLSQSVNFNVSATVPVNVRVIKTNLLTH